jgi:hypothetical protein
LATRHQNNNAKTCLIDTGHAWQVLVALVIVTILFAWLAEAMVRIMPLSPFTAAQARDGSLVLSGILLVISLAALLANRDKTAATALYVFTSVGTLYLLSGVCLMLLGIASPNLSGNEGGMVLLRDAVMVWVINVILFAVWYWLLDGGGPVKRCMADIDRKDFLFPQEFMKIPSWEGWNPGFFSYVFLSFHFCSTFGPSDAYVLSRRGKLLVMIQVAISLITLSMLIARAFSLIV